MRTINQFTEQTTTPGFKTFDNAVAKLEKIRQQTAAEPDRTASALIMRRERDGRFILIIINPDISPVWYVAQGCAVWS